MSTEATPANFGYGITAPQLDLLQQLARRMRALGDVLVVARLSDLVPGTVEDICDNVFESAAETCTLVEKIYSQLLREAPTALKAVTTRKARPVFDSDMDGALLQAFSVMQLMHTAANEDNGLDDASSACQLVSELVWKVHEYVVANFDALPKFAHAEHSTTCSDQEETA